MAADAAITSASRCCTWSSITVFFFVGGVFAVLIRLELLTPAGDLVTAETYNKLFTMHGVMMVFFFLIPSIPADARQLPRADDDRREGPRVPADSTSLSWYIYVLGGAVHARTRSSPAASTPAGRSTRRTARSSSNTQRHRRRRSASSSPASRRSSPASTSSSPIHRMRAPGMTWFRLPLFVWSHLRDQPHHGARHAGARDHGAAGRRRARCCTSASSTRRSAATRCSSSTCSGSTRTRPSTS